MPKRYAFFIHKKAFLDKVRKKSKKIKKSLKKVLTKGDGCGIIL
jgi:hypothetical protein